MDHSNSSSKWYIDENGIYVAVSSGGGYPGGSSSATNYYLYYDNGFQLSTTQQNNITLYVVGDCPTDTLVEQTFTEHINPYTANGGYYLIASPIGTVSPANVSNMLVNDYDLYYFDQNGTDQVNG